MSKPTPPIFNVKNVMIFTYEGVKEIAMTPVIMGADGIYLDYCLPTLEVFGGTRKGKLQLHHKYIATGEYVNGQPFVSPVLICTETDATPRFFGENRITLPDITKGYLIRPQAPADLVIPLTDVTVSQLGDPFNPLIKTLIVGATAKIISKMPERDVEADVYGGQRVGELILGMANIIVTGVDVQNRFTYSGLTCVSTGDPAIFIKL